MLGLVTCLEATSLDDDLPVLTAVLPDSEVVAWDDPAVDWHRFDTLVLRSAWNYPSHVDGFRAWLHHVDELATVWNPVPMIEWNIDKRYLDDLADAGLPIVPTQFVAPDAGPLDDLDLTGDLVVKPTVGAGSQGIERIVGDPDRVRAYIAAVQADGRTAMVQPYRAGVDDHGETGLVYLGGDFSHAFEKEALLVGDADWEGELFQRETVRARTPTPSERALADTVVATLGPTAYARIDLVPGAHGPEILEVELIEPSLYLHLDEHAAARAAHVIRSLTEAP